MHLLNMSVGVPLTSNIASAIQTIILYSKMAAVIQAIIL